MAQNSCVSTKRHLLGDNRNTRLDDFWPFAFGYRKCPGRIFAQVASIAALAALLKNPRLELVVVIERLAICKGNVEEA